MNIRQKRARENVKSYSPDVHKYYINLHSLSLSSLRAAIARSLVWRTEKSIFGLTRDTNRFLANTPRNSIARNASPILLTGQSTNKRTKIPNLIDAKSSGARSVTRIRVHFANTLKVTLKRNSCNIEEPKIKSIRPRYKGQQQRPRLRQLHLRRPDGTLNNINNK